MHVSQHSESGYTSDRLDKKAWMRGYSGPVRLECRNYDNYRDPLEYEGKKTQVLRYLTSRRCFTRIERKEGCRCAGVELPKRGAH